MVYIYIFLVGGLEHGFYDFSIQLGKNIKPLKKTLKKQFTNGKTPSNRPRPGGWHSPHRALVGPGKVFFWGSGYARSAKQK